MGASFERLMAPGAVRSDAVWLSAVVPDEDIRRFNSAMASLIQVAGQTRKEALYHGAMSLASALRASTRIAPKNQPVTKGWEEKFAQNGGRWKNPIWDRKGWKDGKEQKFFGGYRIDPKKKASQWLKERAIEKEEARRRARIGNRGLAKSSWFWFLTKMGKGGSGGGDYLPKVANYVKMSEKETKNTSEIEMENDLYYVRDAFSTGKRTPENSFARASGIIEHYIERQLAKYAKRYG